jgi:hypothetical protein
MKIINDTMTFRHEKLASGAWFAMPFFDQMANIGAEVGRAINWKSKNKDYATNAVERALELLWLTIDDIKNRSRLKELTRVREILIDYFFFENDYKSSDTSWQNYFNAFAYAARRNK